MPKGYWVTTYRSIKDPDKLAAYAKLAPVALAPFGAKYIVRSAAVAASEAGIKQRVVISVFDNVEDRSAQTCRPAVLLRRSRPPVRARTGTHAVQQRVAYSITSSARASSVGGTSRPSAFAVLRLTTSSSLVGNSIGRSPGATPFRILCT